MGGIGGGGGGVDIPQRNWSDEWQGIKKGFQGQENQYAAFRKKDPLLAALYPGAADYFNSPTSPLLTSLQNRALDPSALLTDLNKTVDQPDYLSGKVSASELSNVVDQPTLAKFAAMGNVGGNQAAIQNFLNRDQYVEGRQQQHLGMAQGVEGLNQAQNQFGLGVQSASNQDIAQRFQIPESVFQTGIAGYTGLTNPILQYLSDLNSSNQNAAAAQSIAGANASAGKTSGTLGAVGNIIGGVATAY